MKGFSSDICDSPIERLFIQGWISNHVYAERERLEWTPELAKKKGPQSHKAWLLFREPFAEFHILTQRKVGKYRLDLYVVRQADGKRSAVVVECDGHDFHNITPEQAEKDRRRDRELLRDGFNVIRFTGSELNRDPAACAKEVEEILEAMAK